MNAKSAAAPGTEWFGHPKGLFVCFFTEMWERFSFYGMKALLFLFLTKYHLFSDAPAYDLLGAYGGLVYAVPVVGGLLADRFLGMRKAVVFGGVLLVLGHAGMAFEGHAATRVAVEVVRDGRALQVFYLSLSLIIMGVGFLKPNISTIVGKLYPENDPRRDSGFTLFYAGINVGAFFSSLVCGYLGEKYGWRYGFGAAGIGMLLGLIVFVLGRPYLQGHAEPPDEKKLAERPVRGLPLSREWTIYGGAVLGVFGVWQLIQRTWTVHGAMHVVAALFLVWFVYFVVRKCNPTQRGQMTALLLIIFANLVFFALYEQTYGSWVAFTDRMLSKTLFGITFTAGSLTFLGAFFIVGFSPFFAWLWPALERRGWNPSTPVKCALGLAFGALAFLPLASAAKLAGASGTASVWWLVAAYFVIEIGEMCISPIGLAAVTQLSVASVTSLMMGGWFLATAYSEVLAAGFGKLTAMEEGAEASAAPVAEIAARFGDVFTWMLWLGLGFAVVYVALTPVMRRWMHGLK